MSKSPNDYAAIAQEFIQGDDSVSYRSLGEKHGISFSAVATQGRKKDANGKDWPALRAEFRAQVNSRSMTVAANKIAERTVAIQDTALAVIEAALMKMGMDLRDRKVLDYDITTHKPYERVIPGITVTPSDVAKLITSFQTLIGQPGTITENRNLGITLPNGLDTQFLQLLADAAGEADTGAARRSSLPSKRPAGPN